MELLGSFLSPTNNISANSDKIVKYFYYRPDMYEGSSTQYEDIFDLKAVENFPQRLDELEENPDYVIDTIDISKKVDDQSEGIKKISYIVTCTYDLKTNLSGGGSGSELDDEDNPVTGDTLPWKLRARIDWQPIQVTVPFLKAYNGSGQRNLDVVNRARKSIIK